MGFKPNKACFQLFLILGNREWRYQDYLSHNNTQCNAGVAQLSAQQLTENTGWQGIWTPTNTRSTSIDNEHATGWGTHGQTWDNSLLKQIVNQYITLCRIYSISVSLINHWISHTSYGYDQGNCRPGKLETSLLTLTYFFLYFWAEEMYNLDKIDFLEGLFYVYIRSWFKTPRHLNFLL